MLFFFCTCGMPHKIQLFGNRPYRLRTFVPSLLNCSQSVRYWLNSSYNSCVDPLLIHDIIRHLNKARVRTRYLPFQTLILERYQMYAELFISRTFTSLSHFAMENCKLTLKDFKFDNDAISLGVQGYVLKGSHSVFGQAQFFFIHNFQSGGN